MTRTLVVQGGGMRGAYAAGALVALYEECQETFDEVWATSSGAASAAYAVAEQAEGLDIWRKHLHGSQLLSWRRAFLGGPLLDLDYLIDEVFRRRLPLDVGRLRRAGVPLRVPTTDVETGTVRYFDLARDEPFPVLRAAMSLPGAVRRPVTIEGRRYVDGGVVDQLPLRRAIEAGARDITLILTRPETYEPRPIGRVALGLASARFPKIRPALRRRHREYAAEMALLSRPPDGVRVRTIRPGPEVRMARWTRGRRTLLAAIEAGRQDALRAAAGYEIPSSGAKAI